MWQITEDLIAEITFTTGARLEYLIDTDTLENIRRKMRDGVGSLELTPNFGAENAPAELLNVRAIARVRQITRKNYQDVLVQLWANPVTGRLYLVDPDDSRTGWVIEPTCAERPRDFAHEAYSLIEGSLITAGLGIAVSQPPASDVCWDLIAEYRGEDVGVTLVAKPDDLNPAARTYLASTLDKLPANA